MPKKRPAVRIESTREKGREGPEASNGGEENGQGWLAYHEPLKFDV